MIEEHELSQRPRVVVPTGKAIAIHEIVHKFADVLKTKMEVFLTKHRDNDPQAQRLGGIVAQMHKYALECFEEDIYK